MLFTIKLVSIFLFSTLVAVFLSVPITSFSYLFWLNSREISIGIDILFKSLSHDWLYFSPILFIVYSVGFFAAFIVSKLALSIIKIDNRIAYGLAGAASVATVLYLSVALLFETQIIAGNRYFFGWIFHIIFGFFGGYIFASLLKKI